MELWLNRSSLCVNNLRRVVRCLAVAWLGFEPAICWSHTRRGIMGNCAVNMTAAELNATIEWFERFTLISSIVIPTVYSIVFVAGLVGNATLIYTILANKWMRTKSNVLIVSLAAGDFLLILVSVPFAILIYTTDGWIFGQVMCKVNDWSAILPLISPSVFFTVREKAKLLQSLRRQYAYHIFGC